VQAQLSFPAGFTARCFAHPDTYLNKLVVGSQQGKLQLWNFKAAAMVHEFAGW
jgi:U3 small nucleolar RNA-associated protein 21